MGEIFEVSAMETTWVRASESLTSAAALLVKCAPDVDQVEFRDFLSRNELGMAFDELVDSVGDLELPIEFWVNLDSAARQMHLYSASLNVPHLTRADLCRRHIAAHSESSAG